MKKIMVCLTLSVLAVSCGTEELVTAYAPADNLVSNVALKEKVMRVAQNPTAIDNIIDESDCFSVKIPYGVYVNGIGVAINSTDDYAQVQAILDADDYNYDSVDLIYPVTVVYADYTEETFTTALYFFNARAACTGSRELSCISLTYPVGIKTYTSSNVLAESFEVGTKEALYGFLNTVGGYDAAAFAYPIELVQADGSTISISDNQMLEQLIDSNTTDCEDQFYVPDPLLNDVITQGTWHITYFFNEGDTTNTYEGYNFAFNTDYTVTVTGSTSASGAWSNYATFDVPALNLYMFSDPALLPAEQSWIVTEISTNQVKFFTVSTGVEPQKYLELTKN
jgi:hypothetical protein